MFRERKVGPIINKSKQKSIISGTLWSRKRYTAKLALTWINNNFNLQKLKDGSLKGPLNHRQDQGLECQ